MSDIKKYIDFLLVDIEVDRAIRKLKKRNDNICECDSYCEERCVAIEKILAKLDQDKKRIKELEEIVSEYDKQMDLDYVNKNYISKQKIKEILGEE